jgi:hypothetical protein
MRSAYVHGAKRSRDYQARLAIRSRLIPSGTSNEPRSDRTIGQENVDDDFTAPSRIRSFMWLQRGAYSYSLFMFESGSSERADHSTDENGTTVIIGGEGCRYRVRIDRAD